MNYLQQLNAGNFSVRDKYGYDLLQRTLQENIDGQRTSWLANFRTRFDDNSRAKLFRSATDKARKTTAITNIRNGTLKT